MKLHVFDLDDTLLCGDSEGAWINFLSTKGFFVSDDHSSIMEQFEVDYRSGNFDPEKYCLYILQSMQGLHEKELSKLSEEFIFGLELIPGDARVHYRPQWTFIFDNKNNKKIDFIIRYENLNEDINKFNKKYNLKIPLYGNKNKYSKLNYISKFNKESITKINKLYKNDFELLNYNKYNILFHL